MAIGNFFIILFLLSLPTYFVPDLRIPLSFTSVPYAVPLAVLAALTSIPSVIRRLALDGRYLWVLCFPAFGLINLLSFVLAPEKNFDFGPRLILFSFIPLLFSAILTTPQRQKKAIWILFISSCIALSYGYWGYTSGSTGDPLEHALGYWGITYLPSTRNTDMIYLQAGLWWPISRLLHKSQITNFERVLWFALLALYAGAIVLSSVRGAWVGIAFTLGYAAATGLIPRPRRTTLANLAALVALSFVVVTAISVGGVQLVDADVQRTIGDRFSSIWTFEQVAGGNSNAIRLQLIVETIWIGLRNPIVGVGPGSLFVHYGSTELAGLNHPENWYLNVFAESGFVSLILIFYGIGRIFNTNRRGLLVGPLIMSADHIVPIWCNLTLVNWLFYSMFNQMEDNLWFWTGISICAAVALNPSQNVGSNSTK